MRLTPILIAALILGCGIPALAHPKPISPQYQTDQERDRERNTQAYHDGYSAGQSDARAKAARNETPPSQWTKEDDLRAWRQGYDAGYQESVSAARPAGNLGRGSSQAEQFGYNDGLAAGRHDRLKGEKFHPSDSNMYKDANHGWTPGLGEKDEFKQLYRQGYVRGYQEGYNGSGPR